MGQGKDGDREWESDGDKGKGSEDVLTENTCLLAAHRPRTEESE